MKRRCPRLTQKERILKVGLELYLREGVDGLSMRRIARRLGVVVSSLYKHYANKEELVWAMIAEGYDRFTEYLIQALDAPTPAEQLQRLTAQYLAFALEQPKYYEVIFLNPHHYFQSDNIPDAAREKSRAAFSILERIVKTCMDTRFLKSGDAQAVAYTLWTHAHGAVALRLTGVAPQDETTFSSFYFYSFQNLLNGLKR